MKQKPGVIWRAALVVLVTVAFVACLVLFPTVAGELLEVIVELLGSSSGKGGPHIGRKRGAPPRLPDRR